MGGIGLIQADREATERRNDWHSGEASSFWEAAAAGAAGRPSCYMGGRGLDATERCKVAQWEVGSSWGVAAAGAAGGPSCCG